MSASNIDTLVRGFGRLVSASWPELVVASGLSDTGTFLQDWLQANWEAFVEAALEAGVVLEVYGEGADCNDRSSRVYRPEAVATHAVICVANAGRLVRDVLADEEVDLGHGLPMEELVSMEGQWYVHKPPFDCVLVEGGDTPHVFRLSDVVFALGPATRG